MHLVLGLFLFKWVFNWNDIKEEDLSFFCSFIPRCLHWCLNFSNIGCSGQDSV